MNIYFLILEFMDYYWKAKCKINCLSGRQLPTTLSKLEEKTRPKPIITRSIFTPRNCESEKNSQRFERPWSSLNPVNPVSISTVAQSFLYFEFLEWKPLQKTKSQKPSCPSLSSCSNNNTFFFGWEIVAIRSDPSE